MFELPSFFNSRLEPWIGKVVSQKAQKAQLNGMGWGHRFKVRIMGTYSENDNVEDKDCHTAMVMLGVTDGSGAANRMKSVKITQNDIVFGFFLSPDQNFPVIMGVLGRTRKTRNFGGKFGVLTGFTKNLIRGLTENQEFNECDSVNIPKVVENSKQGDGVGREVNETQLEQMGESTTESNVNTRTEPEGSTQYDTEGLEQSEIDEAIAEEKEFIATQNGDYSDSKIITETDAEREELKNLLEFD